MSHPGLRLYKLKVLIEFAESYFPSFLSYEVSIEDGSAKGDEVTLRAIFKSVQEGEFMGIPATGNKIEFSQMLFSRVKIGKIVETLEDFDSLGMTQQLGFISSGEIIRQDCVFLISCPRVGSRLTKQTSNRLITTAIPTLRFQPNRKNR